MTTHAWTGLTRVGGGVTAWGLDQSSRREAVEASIRRDPALSPEEAEETIRQLEEGLATLPPMTGEERTLWEAYR